MGSPGAGAAAAESGPDGPAEAGTDRWPAFLDCLAGALGAESASLHLVLQGRVAQVWHRGLALSDPERTNFERMRRDRVYSQVDLPGTEAFGQPLRALRWAVGSQGYGVVILQRQAPDFRAADAAQLSRLAPYLGPAMAGWQALEQDRARAALDRRLAADLGGFWLLLTASGRVSDMAPALRARLADIPALRLQPGGWLEFSDPATAQDFRQALAAARSGPCPVELSQAPPLQLVISAESFAGQEVLVGYLRQGPHARALPVERVAEHFGLSRSEARLVLLLCDGFSLQDAAQELGWTRETARSCSKQIFARMGVSGQPGVLRRVLGSAVWLG
ncbi:helix-turn-helix transcriptional regulator [Puniceibacterium confluentis]|uniref:helix-turn-helix transcriptional regulator n=1 Tax=Puniceibacterium confluentis TaxID=1958944 RepID=UPI0011B5CBA3|nr:hypothetical protein [Puniceibacterium confluentis]